MATRRFTFGDPQLGGAFCRPAVTVGVFDGVHRGHEKVLATLKAWAAEASPPVDTVVITFEDHPRHVLTGEGPELLGSVEHRLVLLERTGVSGIVILPFDLSMAEWSPDEFVERVLVRDLAASRVLVGTNHRFGKDRAGDFDLLQSLGRTHDFDAREVELKVDDQVISSTVIRAAIAKANFSEAERLLGRPVSVMGDVVQGDRRGRVIGFPTANLDLHHAARPPRGVYVARARTLDGAHAGPLLPAVVNIGHRPTFHREQGYDLVEVHLLEGGRDLYDQTLEVLFVERLRDERRFDTPADLVAQIERDAAQARDRLAVEPATPLDGA